MNSYTKPRGQQPDYSSPVVLRRGKCTVEDFCNAIHKEIVKQFRNGQPREQLSTARQLTNSNGLGHIGETLARSESRLGPCARGRRVSEILVERNELTSQHHLHLQEVSRVRCILAAGIAALSFVALDILHGRLYLNLLWNTSTSWIHLGIVLFGSRPLQRSARATKHLEALGWDFVLEANGSEQ